MWPEHIAELEERAEKGELTLREAYEALGQCLAPSVPRKFWDFKVSKEDVRNIALHIHVTRESESVGAEELDGPVAYLAERAKRGELTVGDLCEAFGEVRERYEAIFGEVRERCEAIGELLCPTVWQEIWDSKVSMALQTGIDLRRAKTPESVSLELEGWIARLPELAERAKRGELTLRELHEALGWPLSMLSTGEGDRKVTLEDIRKIELYLRENR